MSEVLAGSPTVLIVEDNRILADLVAQALSKLNIVCEIAHDCADALNALAHHNTISSLVADYQLGDGMNGIELISSVKKDNPAMRCVLMSGYLADLDVSELAPPIILLDKPFALADLMTIFSDEAS